MFAHLKVIAGDTSIRCLDSQEKLFARFMKEASEETKEEVFASALKVKNGEDDVVQVILYWQSDKEKSPQQMSDSQSDDFSFLDKNLRLNTCTARIWDDFDECSYGYLPVTLSNI